MIFFDCLFGELKWYIGCNEYFDNYSGKSKFYFFNLDR